MKVNLKGKVQVKISLEFDALGCLGWFILFPTEAVSFIIQDDD